MKSELMILYEKGQAPGSDNFLRRTALYELRVLSIDREVLERLD
jgi:hypothetical protein